MSVYLLCKGGFICGGKSQEEQSRGFPPSPSARRLFSAARDLGPPFVTSPDFLSRKKKITKNELSLHMHS